MGFGTPPPPPGVTKHTELTDKEVEGVIDHADASVSDAKLASGVGLSDGQICKLPTATPDQILKRGAAAWEAGMEKNPWDDYFYWLCLFESLDSFYVSDGVALSDAGYLTITTPAATNEERAIYKDIVYHGWLTYDNVTNVPTFTWDKKRKLRTCIRFGNNAAQEIWIISGDFPNWAHIGFKVVNNKLYGTVADGTAESTLEILTITAGKSYLLECILTPGVNCRFYVDKVDKGAIATNLPAGETSEQSFLIYVSVKTKEDVAKGIRLSMWEFWQDR